MKDKKSKVKIYLDHNATTPLHPEVRRAMIAAMDNFGNPSSLHTFGRQARALVEESRQKIASFIAAKSEEIIFVGSGSEANNTVLNLFSCNSSKCNGEHFNKRKIITTKIEHPCILEAAGCLQDRGQEIKYIGVDKRGKINLEELKATLGDNSALVSIMLANNEIGTIQDLKEISRIVHGKGALLHTDAIQAVGKIPVNVNDLEIDYLSFSAHKIYGPKGIGALYVRKGSPFCPFVRGGHQERGRRAGTENTLGIIGLAKAIEMRQKEMVEENKRLKILKEKFKKGIEKNISDVYFNGHPKEGLVSTLNVSFSGVEGEAVLLYLDLEGIFVSTGSACASGSLGPSHVLLATGIPSEHAHGSIRMSMGRGTSQKDIDYVIKKLTQVIQRVRKISSVNNEVKYG
ncbi:MAG: cysteine desulfurase family protein [Candidatus Omnitrophota bacterium]|nr:cysteine desulfurase [Candidatus Omnitrophota bacterium]